MMRISNSAEKVTFNKAGAPELQQTKSVSKQPMCKQMGDGDSCKGGDAGAVKSDFFGRIRYKLCVILFFFAPLFLCSEEPDVDLLIENQSAFAFALYPKLNGDSNCVFSPYSVATCLCMAYLGARDVTEREMQQALYLDMSAKEIATPSALLNQSLLPANSKKGYELTLANALWVDEKTYILANFRFAIEKQFGAKIANVSFSQPENALASINAWIADQTKGHIQNLLTRNDISSSTRMLLTNAAYFKGAFLRPFHAKSTKDAPFTLLSEKTETVKMMEQTAFFPYTENDLFQAVALPFLGASKGQGQIALVVLLPKSSENFALLQQTAADAFENTLLDLKEQKTHLELPKYVVSKRYSLNEPLQQLGMKNPFTTQANFSGIDGRTNLYLNQVVHEAYFSLDENGVTAAAATGASMNVTAAPSENPPAEFIADHPFLFFIVDLKSKEVLFMGKCADPSDTL